MVNAASYFLTPVRKPVPLRPSSSDLLVVPKVNTNIETRIFAVGAPSLWDMLPSSVNQLKILLNSARHLKTYLYNLAYPPLVPGVSINQSDDKWICLLTLRSNNPFLLMHL